MAETGPAMVARLLTAELTPYERDAIGEVVITPPNQLWTTSHTLYLGDRQVQLRHLGKGHTDNDIVVRVSDSTVTIAGDLVKSNGPPGYRDAFFPARRTDLPPSGQTCQHVGAP